ncbi:MAG: ABC transporter ATP-binding protein/permease [Erysipelotrichaceae bacterium]|jgi:ATP-binding cassette subfamily B protein|nr:ABC transporter ATP-binding protein/permease [Erysipelotrichaceae bacterium]MCI1326828.1 ABC transporter ATP-binding protein/permease [Solobacterium sp.]MCH4043457.1 ABC transporter ATP-binding protein/permease [Erysipelotrichaceae bacterium]MCH4120680.1 ABC transporter ATP-binding protein/permease [Erysipelotrichaceae bacterium]MCI1384829.1 ABC transporter ATP-binding protein/permease [Solobacterium sp.]
MLKAFRYLKPYWLSVLAIIGLIFGQVQAELALPDYMSDIVTYGIQYGGVRESVPEAMRASTLQHMSYFADDAADAWTIVSKGDSDYEKEYPAAKEEDIAVLKDGASPSDQAKKAFLLVSLLDSEDVLKQLNMTSADQLYAAMDASPAIKEQILSTADEKISGFTQENLTSAEIMAVKSEYTALGMDMAHLQSSYILSEGGKMLVIAALGSLAALIAAYLASRTATGACRDMRRDVFARVESFSSEEFSHFSTASLITRTTNDIQQVQQVITMMLRIVLFAPLMGLTSLLKVLRYPGMFSILLWIIAAIVVLMLVSFILAMPRFKKIQQLVDRLNLVTREQLEGMLVIRAFNNQKTEEKRFDAVNKDITSVNIFVNRLMAVMMPAMTFLMSFVSVLIIWYGARQIDAGTMQIGAMMAFLQYAMHVLISFMIVAAIFIMIPRSSVSAKRIFEVLETKPTILDPDNPKQMPEEAEPIVFDHVSFRYPGAEKDVLEDISFTANPGETVAFIGSTGSGKSTLINLIPRFFDVTKGAIYYGDTDIREVTQHDLREKIGYVPQQGVLFSGTVLSNLKYADPNASNETVKNALAVSQAQEFVSRMPEGVNTPIAQGGTNVSGGQKQRLSIARALTRSKAQILIFDDTFSALDYATDAKLRSALHEMVQKTKATVFIVAQRISTIRHADRIVVLDEGRVAGIGTHEELMKDCRVYQEIARSQLNQEELAR